MCAFLEAIPIGGHQFETLTYRSILLTQMWVLGARAEVREAEA